MRQSLLQTLAGSLALRVVTAAPVDNNQNDIGPQNFLAEAGLFATDNYHPLTRTVLTGGTQLFPPGAAEVWQLLDRRQKGTAQMKAVPSQTLYLMQVGIGGQTWSMIADSGSSDTWLVSSNFKCTDKSGKAEAQSACAFGPTYGGTYSGGAIPNQNLNVSYGGGANINGGFGYQAITAAGITVHHQQMSLITSASIQGNGVFSGILGLGFKGLTTSYPGNDPTKDNPSQETKYAPFLETMTTGTGIGQSFSVALSRTDSRSYIAFGGVPPAVKTGPVATAPMVQMKFDNGPPGYYYYAVKPDSVSYNNGQQGSTWSNPTPMIVDTGTTLNYFPSNIASAINNLFDPPAQEQNGAYIVKCNAKAPAVSITIGGKAIPINPSSMIIPGTAQSQSDGQYCLSGIGAAQDENMLILGNTFQEELLVVFDFSAKKQIRFAVRTD